MNRAASRKINRVTSFLMPQDADDLIDVAFLCIHKPGRLERLVHLAKIPNAKENKSRRPWRRVAARTQTELEDYIGIIVVSDLSDESIVIGMS